MQFAFRISAFLTISATVACSFYSFLYYLNHCPLPLLPSTFGRKFLHYFILNGFVPGRSFANAYGDTTHVPTSTENQKVLQRASQLGITLIDTADV